MTERDERVRMIQKAKDNAVIREIEQENERMDEQLAKERKHLISVVLVLCFIFWLWATIFIVTGYQMGVDSLTPDPAPTSWSGYGGSF